MLVEVLFLAEAADVSPPHGDGAGAADDDDDEDADGEREHRHHGHRVADGEARRGPQHAAAVVHHEQVAALVRPLHLPHLQPRRVAVLDEMLLLELFLIVNYSLDNMTPTDAAVLLSLS